MPLMLHWIVQLTSFIIIFAHTGCMCNKNSNNNNNNVRNVVVLVVGILVVIKFSKFENFFSSQPIVIKLRLLIGDNIPDFCTVLDFLSEVVIN